MNCWGMEQRTNKSDQTWKVNPCSPGVLTSVSLTSKFSFPLVFFTCSPFIAPMLLCFGSCCHSNHRFLFSVRVVVQFLRSSLTWHHLFHLRILSEEYRTPFVSPLGIGVLKHSSDSWIPVTQLYGHFFLLFRHLRRIPPSAAGSRKVQYREDRRSEEEEKDGGGGGSSK